MSLKIGFVLLTHNRPAQATRLVAKLNRMFDAPPIAWHHDFSQSSIPVESIPNNASIVRPHVATSWASFSVVDATMAALELLFQRKEPPDWFFLLSGADYPIKSADKIVDDLSKTKYDAHIHHEKICFNEYQRDWQQLCYKRYCSLRFRVPIINRKLRVARRTIRISHPLLAAPFLPFSRELSCFAGEHWFSANRRAADYLLTFHKEKRALANHYRRTALAADASYRSLEEKVVPEESYYQTILANAGHLTLSQDPRRYIDWSRNGPHPKTLMTEDLPKLDASTAYFARKFDADVDAKILDALDTMTETGRHA